MGNKTVISWTDHTFNPWIGCCRVSAGCAHCYAEADAERYGENLWGKDAERRITKSPWENVRRWEKEAAKGIPGILGKGFPHLVFTGSMMDWAEDREDLLEVRGRMWTFIQLSPHLHFQLLTKRPENIEKFLPADWGKGYANVWLGTSIENMKVASRADILREIPALVHFISYEPALGPLDNLNLSGIDWVIYGGESGINFRKEDKNWARVMHTKCLEEEVAFFHKQSASRYTEQGTDLDGEIIHEFPPIKLAPVKDTSTWLQGMTKFSEWTKK